MRLTYCRVRLMGVIASFALVTAVACGDDSSRTDPDAGAGPDAGILDASADAQAPDGAVDTGVDDAGAPDTGAPDTGPAEPTCDDGVANGDERDVDCGGDCGACVDGLSCETPEHCLSGRCDDGTCASCRDGVRSGDETAVDCGGGCTGCLATESCAIDDDCRFGSCTDGACRGPEVLYYETFEDDDGGWVSGGSRASWAWGVPDGEHFAQAGQGRHAWVTGLDGTYRAVETSWVRSPLLDLSGTLDDPVLELLWSVDTDPYDHAWLEMSTDGGVTWGRVGASGDPDWYTDAFDHWNGTSEGWVRASQVLTGAAGSATVVLRFRMFADGTDELEGFGFDDVRIRTADPGDLEVTITPSSTTCGVRAVVTNVGGASVPRYTLTITRDETPEMVEVMTPVAPGASRVHEIVADAELVRVAVASAVDVNPANDVAEGSVAGSRIVLDGDGYFEDFEAGEGGFIVAGGHESWEYGVPAGTTIDSAYSGTHAWVTVLDGDYPNSEDTDLLSPCFDASATTEDLVLSFAHAYETQFSSFTDYDYGYVDYSVDGGASWVRLPDPDGAVNWPLSIFEGTADWATSSSRLTGSSGAALVRLRWHLKTSFSTTEEGWAIDDISLSESTDAR